MPDPWLEQTLNTGKIHKHIGYSTLKQNIEIYKTELSRQKCFKVVWKINKDKINLKKNFLRLHESYFHFFKWNMISFI